MIPISSHIARSIREAVRCYEDGLKWDEARERIVTLFGHHNACNAIPNPGFTIIGWLYGGDYGDQLCKAVNCAYDTDCTGATLGSLLGIIHGASGIPEAWKKPVGDAITPVKYTVIEGLPRTIDELARRTQKVAEACIAQRSQTVAFSEETSVPGGVMSLLFANDRVRDLLVFDTHCSVEHVGDLQVIFHYGGEPVLRPGIRRVFEVPFRKAWKPMDASAASIAVKAPSGWQVSDPVKEDGRHKFSVLADPVKDRHVLALTVKVGNRSEKVNFTLLGPGAIRSIPASTSTPKDR